MLLVLQGFSTITPRISHENVKYFLSISVELGIELCLSMILVLQDRKKKDKIPIAPSLGIVCWYDSNKSSGIKALAKDNLPMF
jgi:hypothetical protein